jgi:hypothetical protein
MQPTVKEKEIATIPAEVESLSTVEPRDVVSLATDQANALMEIVEARKLYQDIKGKRYLTAEAWETIGAFNNVHAVTEFVRPVLSTSLKKGAAQDDEVEVIGYQAKVNLVKNSEVVGSGVMSCGLEEFPCQGRHGMAKDRAAMSAAQTWATSKAFRLNYSWVAVLAGFEPTPAEEMAEDENDPYICPVHRVKWFKKGKMKSYAHPIEGSDGQWCNMPTKDPVQVQEASAEYRAESEDVESGKRNTLQNEEAESIPVPDASDPDRRFANRGHLMVAAQSELHLGMKAVCKILGIDKVNEIPDDEGFSLAWRKLVEGREEIKNS